MTLEQRQLSIPDIRKIPFSEHAGRQRRTSTEAKAAITRKSWPKTAGAGGPPPTEHRIPEMVLVQHPEIS